MSRLRSQEQELARFMQQTIMLAHLFHQGAASDSAREPNSFRQRYSEETRAPALALSLVAGYIAAARYDGLEPNLGANMGPASPPPFVRDAMYRRLGQIHGMSVVESFCIACFSMELLELFGGWQHWVGAVVASAAAITFSKTDRIRGLWALALFFIPLVSRLGGVNLFRAIYIALSDNAVLATYGCPPFTLQYAQKPRYILALTLFRVIPQLITGLILPWAYSWLAWFIPNRYKRTLLLSVISTLFLAPLIGVWAPSIRRYVPRVTRRLIKVARRTLILGLKGIDALESRTLMLIGQVGVAGAAEPYVYTKLDPGLHQIRVLKLKPRNGAVVECELETISIGGKHIQGYYEAVSYRWRPGKARHLIKIGDKRFVVNESVFKLLRGLQYPTQSRVIWIDSICINQQDNDEKNTQIPLMRNIYRWAWGVIAWLGDSSESTGTLTFLSSLAVNPPTAERLKNMMFGLAPLELYSWQKVAELFRHEYFTRMWMIQEVALARKVILKHGSEEMDWEDFKSCIAFLCSSTGEQFLLEPDLMKEWYKDPKVLSGVMNAGMMDMLKCMVSGDEAPRVASGPMSDVQRAWLTAMDAPRDKDGLRRLPLEMVLGYTIGFDATDPKDKIYGVLGMTSLKVDIEYRNELVSPTRVIQDAARKILLDEGGTLHHFHLAGWGSRHLDKDGNTLGVSRPPAIDLPSWVPEWHVKKLEKPAFEGYVYYAGRPDGTVRHRFTPFSEEGPDLKPNHIAVQASPVARIAKLGVYISFQQMDQGDPARFREGLGALVQDARRLARDVPASRYRLDSPEHALWRTIFGDIVTGHVGGIPDHELRRLRTTTEVFAGLSSGLTASEIASLTNLRSLKTLHELGRGLIGRRLCVTEEGYLATVPPGARPGDRICIVWGASTPFVTRSRRAYEEGIGRSIDMEFPDEGEDVLIGSCYLHGFMRGEASMAQYPPERIVLR